MKNYTPQELSVIREYIYEESKKKLEEAHEQEKNSKHTSSLELAFGIIALLLTIIGTTMLMIPESRTSQALTFIGERK